MGAEHTVALPGATPESLMSYLKGLGTLRLIAGVDHDTRACWKGGVLQLASSLDADALERFLLDEYRPSPIISPWNAGSGFWDSKAAGKALRKVEESASSRLSPIRDAILSARSCIAEFAVTQKSLKDKRRKVAFLKTLRSRLPDEALAWLDSAAILSETAQFAPLLGTGGNDGRLDFSSNFLQRLAAIMPFDASSKPPTDHVRRQSAAWLEAALFGTAQPNLLPAAAGQFHPGGVGGPNATSGFEGDSLVNPWDFVLMLEGALVLSGASTRRLGLVTGSRPAFPFTVETTPAGQGALSDGETTSARAEVWLPTWPRPAVYPEVRRLFAEGRAQVGRRYATTGLDFARAVAGLGVDRGVDSFNRFGFVQRSGLNYLATPLGRFPVRGDPDVWLLDQADHWLTLLRRRAQSNTAPASLRSSLRRVEDAIFAYCGAPARSRLQDVLAALGRTERLLAQQAKGGAEHANAHNLPPLFGLEPAWLAACENGRAELHLAAAVASIDDPRVGPLREQLEPVRRSKYGYVWSDDVSGVVAGGAQAPRVLAAVLERRLLLAQRHVPSAVGQGEGEERRSGPPIKGHVEATAADVQSFVAGRTQDERLLDLLFAIATFRWPAKLQPPDGKREETPLPKDLNRAYALMKLTFAPDGVPTGNGDVARIHPDPAVLNLLRAGRLQDAVMLCARRLFAAGLPPLGYRPSAGSHSLPFQVRDVGEAERIAAALLIPLRDADSLVKLAVRSRPDQAS